MIEETFRELERCGPRVELEMLEMLLLDDPPECRWSEWLAAVKSDRSAFKRALERGLELTLEHNARLA